MGPPKLSGGPFILVDPGNKGSILKHSDRRMFFPIEAHVGWTNQSCPYSGHLGATRNYGHVLIHDVSTHTYTNSPLCGKSSQ